MHCASFSSHFVALCLDNHTLSLENSAWISVRVPASWSGTWSIHCIWQFSQTVRHFHILQVRIGCHIILANSILVSYRLTLLFIVIQVATLWLLSTVRQTSHVLISFTTIMAHAYHNVPAGQRMPHWYPNLSKSCLWYPRQWHWQQEWCTSCSQLLLAKLRMS